MKPTHDIPAVRRPLLLLLLTLILVIPGTTNAQVTSSWLFGSSWWDWSDYRAYLGFRIFLPSVKGTVEARGESHDLTHFGITSDPELFKSAYLEFYVDRLGLRAEIEEDHKFRGRTEVPAGSSVPTLVDLTPKISELDMSTNKLGLDLDIIRYPVARAGINATYHTDAVKFYDRRLSDPSTWRRYISTEPITIGVHGRVIPLRIRDVPVTLQGRFRFPVPFLDRTWEGKVTEWEVSGGLRPAVWSTSLWGHSTFSFGIEGGYRTTYFKMNKDDVSVSARWNGAFVQAAIFY